MPRCEFSETQFSFCFTFEFIRKYTPFFPFMPYFPSTYKEGQKDHGFDVQITRHIFFQFKVPTYITLKRIDNAHQWNVFGKPFYRSKINTNSEQHRLLWDLKVKNNLNEVFYVMPEFNDNNSMSNYYLNKKVTEKSAIFPLENIPRYQSGFHHICYDNKLTYGKMFSQPVNVDKIKLENRLKEIFHIDKESTSMFDEAKSIFNLLNDKEYLSQDLIQRIKVENEERFINMIKDLLLSHFNIIWLPIIRNESTSIVLRYNL